MSVTITIRTARLADLATLTDIAIRSKQSNGYDEAFMLACREELTMTPAHLRQSHVWVAAASHATTNDKESIVGHASLTIDSANQSGEVETFFVDPAWQRRGVGRALWNTILQHATTRNTTSLYLDADPHAVPFYEAQGFSTVGESPSGSIPGRTLPRMSRPVTCVSR